ncbi:hypothetical protein MAR_032999 [Mya arenaria]|uniref:DZIP3-like HEPN domain-containing protein n=1 Tax=Mya arenaria TaxID=6604 RepID=A0ABY7G7R2_MYAAR|nr:hypothetical protein MAR_032999 [Mya arenaria]
MVHINSLFTCRPTMSDRYYRLVTMLLDISLPALRDLFVHCAQNDTNVTFTTLEGYMNSRKNVVDALVRSRVLRKDQYNIVFPTSGTFDETKWDMSLLSSLLISMFGQTTAPVKNEIQLIRDMRNKLSHRSDTNMIESEYNTLWTDIDVSTIAVIAFFKSSKDEQNVRKDIKSLKTRTLDPSKTLEIINTWYLGVGLENAAEIRSLREEVGEMKQKLEEVGNNTSFTSRVIQNTTVKRKGRSGIPSKRMKTLSTCLEGFKGDFIPPEQVGTIQQKLEDDHLAIVVGYGESAYLSTVFHAIKEIEYEPNRSALLTDPSDWIHVDPDDVHIVVFKNPFGSVVFDQNKATTMFNKLEDIKNSCEDSKLDVVIASKGEILDEAMRVIEQRPDVFDDKIVVYKGGSAPTPSSLIEMSKYYAEDLQKTTPKTSDTNYRTILSKLNDKHCVVLSATDSEGLSKCIAYLTEAFPTFLNVSHRDDLMHAKLDSTGVVVVVDMAGKYVYDMLRSNQWLETFDFMKPMVQNGKPNIAVVMDKTRLHECLRKTGMHWIFQNVLEMFPSGYIVEVDAQKIILNEVVITNSVSIQTDLILRHVADIELVQSDGDDEQGSITGMTVVEDRLLVAVDDDYNCLRCFDLSTSTQISRYDKQVNGPYDITTLPGSRVAVTFPYDGEIHFFEVKSQSGEFLFIKKINVDSRCIGIVYSDDKLIVSYMGYIPNKVQILDMEANVQQLLQTNYYDKSVPSNPQYVAVSPDHNTIYVSDQETNTVAALTRDGHVLGVLQDEDNLMSPCGLTVDAQGCVYVCNYRSDTVCLVSPETGSVTRLVGKENGICNPQSVAVCDKTRCLYVGMPFSSTIKVFKIE